jgi:hypothetical protein
MEWLIIYLNQNDENAPQYTQTVIADDYTSAYVNFYVTNKSAIILDIKKL